MAIYNANYSLGVSFDNRGGGVEHIFLLKTHSCVTLVPLSSFSISIQNEDVYIIQAIMSNR